MELARSFAISSDYVRVAHSLSKRRRVRGFVVVVARRHVSSVFMERCVYEKGRDECGGWELVHANSSLFIL